MGIDIDVKRGNPDPAKISTSYVKRQNLRFAQSCYQNCYQGSGQAAAVE